MKREDWLILPYQCGYELVWKQKRERITRRVHVDARMEPKAYIENSHFENRKFIGAEELSHLPADEGCRSIDETPEGMIEVMPRLLTAPQHELVKPFWFKHWINYDLWNPIYSISAITDVTLAKLWKAAFECCGKRVDEQVAQRGNELARNLEFLSLLQSLDSVQTNNKNSDSLKKEFEELTDLGRDGRNREAGLGNL